ncbi:MoaD/ThiS family protein [Nannocystis sp.]|uniref:MoaD/ThiS family protein n=1 Tax=Nannocystis sp. TaxID=1962667 RepID=UPI0025CC2875|nr:MoaD/ThiS family protein [Nannocystis sp.]MBK7827261.1 MoaD/ThiS family protein [Nannocystis sp.]
MVTVELYGLPRLRAGAERCELAPGRLRELLAALAAALPGLVPDILRDGGLSEHALLAVDGRDLLTDPEAQIPDGAVLVLISAQAGG